jgi:glucoamylase
LKTAVPERLDRLYLPDLRWGEGTGSATPLAWSMAQFIRLATNIAAGRNLETPEVVYQRYAGRNRGN